MPNDFLKNVTLKNGKIIVLRHPVFSDAQELMNYINPIILEPARILTDTPKTLEDEQKFLKEIAERLEKDNSVALVAEADGKIIGMTDVRRNTSKQRHSGGFGLSVAKEYRGLGLGKILAQEALTQAKSIMKLEMVILSVFKQNVNAVKLYEDLGFVQFGSLPRALYHEGNYETELFMYKNL